MTTDPNMPISGPQINDNAVSVYGQDDALDDFPVLKAFQQYIDSEQNKARKRLMVLCSFFGFLMMVVVTVFVIMLMNISARNQSLNDRLFEFAMRNQDRGSNGSAVVVQPPQDSSAILALTAKIDEMKKKLAEDQANAEKAAAEAAARAEKAALEAALPKKPTAEEIEIKHLKDLLIAEREKNSLEKERQKQAEIEAYRRKHYPELYEDEDSKPLPKTPVRKRQKKLAADELIEEVDKILEESKSISYFNEDEDEEDAAEDVKPKNNSIPVEIKGSSSSWQIPED